MIYRLAHAHGSPSRTAVVNVKNLPDDESILESVVRDLAKRLHSRCRDLITKFALLRPSRHPLFDLDYRFAQVIPPAAPGGELLVDWRGSCGHSILASVAVAAEWNWVPKLTPGARTRVEVLNNNDVVITEAVRCEVDRIGFTAHFPQDRCKKASSLLLTGQPRTMLLGEVEATLLSAGNPYVFVDARRLGIASPAQMFSAGDEFFDRLESIRRAASTLLGSRSHVFPKICCVGAYGDVLAVRAISVPRFHPTLALTGLIALGAAAVLPGTVVRKCVEEVGDDPTSLRITTPNGNARVQSLVRGAGMDACIECISVPNKRVWLGGRSARSLRAIAS